MSRKILIVATLATAEFFWLPASAQTPNRSAQNTPAPAVSEPQITTATYGDWILRCVRTTGDKPVKSCEIVETLQVQGQGTVAQIAFSKPGPKDPFKATVVLPNNIALPGSVKFAVDEKDNQPADLPWRRCVPGGCFADADIKDDVLKKWGGSEKGEIRFKNGAGQDVTLPMSFRGLIPALEALAKG